MPKALLPKLVNPLKEIMQMGILEPPTTSYSNCWFTVPKKFGSLKFIQYMQLTNKVIIINKGLRLIVDEVVEVFARHVIYSTGDLYFGYDQFQLALHEHRSSNYEYSIGTYENVHISSRCH